MRSTLMRAWRACWWHYHGFWVAGSASTLMATPALADGAYVTIGEASSSGFIRNTNSALLILLKLLMKRHAVLYRRFQRHAFDHFPAHRTPPVTQLSSGVDGLIAGSLLNWAAMH